MTTNTTIINRALQGIGTRTTVTDAELANNTSNEAIQANLILTNTRDDLLRMAPWDCATNFKTLNLICALPGTPENTSAATAQWAKGQQPAPPWLYEYQYPVDCLRALWIVPQLATGVSGIPIFPVLTGFAPLLGQGPAVKFKVGIDQFYPVLTATPVAGGATYAVGDLITLPITAPGATQIGYPVTLRVTGTGALGAVASVAVVNQIGGSDTPQGGSYFFLQPAPVPQGTTTGFGSGATFSLTYGPQGDQRVILTNQEFAILSYCKQVTDPNVMDTLFQSAWVDILSANLVYALTGDKTLANLKIAEANNSITEARKADGNEGLTVNDHTPDWIRARGICYPNDYGLNGMSYDWGSLWPTF